jgi:hypothetical protein
LLSPAILTLSAAAKNVASSARRSARKGRLLFRGFDENSDISSGETVRRRFADLPLPSNLEPHSF